MNETRADVVTGTSLLHRASVLAMAIRSCPSDPEVQAAARLLPDLRDAREFDPLVQMAELVCRFAPDNFEAKIMLVQGLIESGHLVTAIGVAEAALLGLGVQESEFHELSGLLGRANKQLYIDHTRASDSTRQQLLKRAWQHYAVSFEHDPAQHFWQGINLAALSHAAASEGLTTGWPSAPDLAATVIQHLDLLPADKRDHYWHATLAEALVAQERWAEAHIALEAYVAHPGSTAFGFASTLRQLRELWGLSERSDGLNLLQRFESLLMRDWVKGELSALTLKAGHVQRTQVAETDSAELQRQFGPKGAATIEWYRQGLACAASVAAIEEYLGVRFGTGFLVKGKAFGHPNPDELLLLTNFHVINSEMERTDPGFENIRVKFEALPGGMRELEVSGVIAESPTDTGLDYALLTLRGDTQGMRGLDVAEHVPAKKTRVYVIGCPLGQVMQISLHDSLLLDHECPETGCPPVPARRRLHYSAATEKGSSGSPVFDEKWRCIGLHHAGGKVDPRTGKVGLPRLNGGLTMIEANQGIWMHSIIEDARKQITR